MKIDFHMPVKIISGIGCVKNNSKLFKLGSHALIVTGRHSAEKSGALADVTDVLGENGIGYTVYNEISENPLLSACFSGGQIARESGADFVIGIGGGSAMDAAKAVAAFAANPGIGEYDLFGGELKPSLPLIEIPTTAGTGSEANWIAVLSLDGKDKKKSFKSLCSFARYAFVDPKYTYSLSYGYTVSTALDAFCHCIESFLSPKSTEITRMMGVSGAADIWKVLCELSPDKEITPEQRELLINGSCLAGIAINGAGTGFPHPLGYNLTMFKGIPHGRACAVFTGEYVRYNMKTGEGKALLEAFAAGIGSSADEIAARIPGMADVNLKLTDEEIVMFIDHVADAGNYANSPYVINKDEMREIYTRIFA